MTQIYKIIAYEQDELDNDQILELFQELIDTGLAWQLQGSYGRLAHDLITQGYCQPAPRPNETDDES